MTTASNAQSITPESNRRSVMSAPAGIEFWFCACTNHQRRAVTSYFRPEDIIAERVLLCGITSLS
jgi:hypothetical protein